MGQYAWCVLYMEVIGGHGKVSKPKLQPGKVNVSRVDGKQHDIIEALVVPG